jgi:hypothetical protein
MISGRRESGFAMAPGAERMSKPVASSFAISAWMSIK